MFVFPRHSEASRGPHAPRRSVFGHPAFRAAMAMLSVWCMAPGGCGGGGGTGVSSSGVSTTAPTNPAAPVAGTTPNLTESDVNTIVLQAVHEATARGKPATIAIVDRVGNVLTVTQMPGAPGMATITSGRGNNTGLENVQVPTTLAAIAKADTGAYLSSNGNAFSTRTANYIIQEHFPPGVQDAPGGPLFGVQFSQLPCSDFNTPAATAPGATSAGPHRSPLGFSADSGGYPLYKNGVLAGGIGVMTKDVYSDNLNTFAVPIDDDEVIALAGSTGYTPPSAITADNIAINGLTLQYADATPANFAAPVAATGSFTPVAVTGFFAGPAAGHTAIDGTTYGSTDGASGVAPDGALGPMLYPGTSQTSFVFTDGSGHVLYAPTDGLAPAGQAITAAEAQAMMTSTLNVAYSARAAIRIPTNTFPQVTATIVDIDGNVLAQARTPDAPVFGADVSRQKARTAVFFSRTDAAAKVNAITIPASTVPGTFADYITRSQSLVSPTVFSDGLAWSEVSIGDIARPFYPDGIDGNPPGSLSLPFSLWSVFSTGFQLDLVKPDFVNALTGVPVPAAGCGTGNGQGLAAMSGGKTQLADGAQIFSGGAPLYRGNTLVGAIGVSGDGIQQDSLISFLGTQNANQLVTNAPLAIRSDILNVGGVRLRYVNCPAAPFLNSTVQNPC
ncbi:MAG TPA: heme-binding protein [Stellaceae bacterium]|nr:heme-binding protein [Stellaceae bacterium]